jgi:hypothetical protein
MIGLTPIFFDPGWPRRALERLTGAFLTRSRRVASVRSKVP